MGWRWWHFLFDVFVEKWFGWIRALGWVWLGCVELLGRCWWMRVVRGTGLGPSLTAAHSEAAPNLSPPPCEPRCAGYREYREYRVRLECLGLAWHVVITWLRWLPGLWVHETFPCSFAAWTVGGGQLTGRGGWGPPLNAQQSVKAPAHPGTAAGLPRPSATMPAHPPHPPLPTNPH